VLYVTYQKSSLSGKVRLLKKEILYLTVNNNNNNNKLHILFKWEMYGPPMDPDNRDRGYRGWPYKCLPSTCLSYPAQIYFIHNWQILMNLLHNVCLKS